MKVASRNTIDTSATESLYEAFLENFNALGRRKNNSGQANADVLGNPGVEQYRAFAEIFAFIKDGAKFFEDRAGMMSDFFTEDRVITPLEEFLDSLSSYDLSGKKLILNSYLCWGMPDGNSAFRSDGLRLSIGLLEDDGLEVSQKLFGDDVFAVREKKGFPVHFAKFGDEKLFIEFPHTASSMFRLSDVVALDQIPYADGKDKAQFSDFLDRKFVYGTRLDNKCLAQMRRASHR